MASAEAKDSGESQSRDNRVGKRHTPMGHITVPATPPGLEERRVGVKGITMASATPPPPLSFRRNVYKIPYREVVVMVVSLGTSLTITEGGSLILIQDWGGTFYP